ncbi:hypothetical protein ACFL09_00400 [Planctomycetota bacterium]
MRSKPVVIVLAILCGVMVLVCLPMALKFWKVFRTRRTFASAVDHYNGGRYDQALTALDTCAKTMPGNVVVYQLAGFAATKLPDPDYARARGYYEAMLEFAEGKDATDAHLALGGLYLRKDQDGQRDLDKAIEHLKAALEGNDELTDAHGALGIAYVLKGKPTTAEEHLERAWQDYESGQHGTLGSTARLWQIAAMLKGGELVEASRAYQDVSRISPEVPSGKYLAALALARAFRVNDDGLSSTIRQHFLTGTAQVPASALKKHGFRIYTLAATANERLGKHDAALKYYRQAHGADPKSALGRRNVAHALFQAAERTQVKEERAKLRDESLGIYKELVAEKQLTDAERKQVTLALASFAWNEGNKAEAQKLIQSIGSSSSALTERIQAAEAMRAKDYKKAVGHLKNALKADPKQPDVAALVERFQTPPEIRSFRVNTMNPYDTRPLITAGFLPRALPEPIPSRNVKLELDGSTVKPVFSKAEVFFVPQSDLSTGKHKMVLTVTDTLGLTATKTLNFTIAQDTKPPSIVGITPAPDSVAENNPPVIAFRASDPSGVASSSMSVTFMRAGSGGVDIIEGGRYKVGFKKGDIEKGTPVRLGSVRFQFSKTLKRGEYSLRVGVSDAKGNRTVKRWSFKVE